MPRKNNPTAGVFIVFTLYGLLFFAVGVFVIANSVKFHISAKETDGVITNITAYYDSDDDLQHRVYVRYFVDGREYESEYGTYYTGMTEGQKVKVYYDPGNPRHIRSKGASIVGYAFMCFGSIGFLPLFMQMKAKSKKKHLIAYGYKITAVIKEIVGGNIYVNNRRCRNIICEYTDRTSGTIYRFKSGNIWGDLAGLDEGKTVSVYVDYNDYSKYHVDTEELLSEIDAKVVDYT